LGPILEPFLSPHFQFGKEKPREKKGEFSKRKLFSLGPILSLFDRRENERKDSGEWIPTKFFFRRPVSQAKKNLIKRKVILTKSKSRSQGNKVSADDDFFGPIFFLEKR
jgi:hypothetical protein